MDVEGTGAASGAAVPPVFHMDGAAVGALVVDDDPPPPVSHMDVEAGAVPALSDSGE